MRAASPVILRRGDGIGSDSAASLVPTSVAGTSALMRSPRSWS